MTAIPHHDYELVEGTEPTTHGKHEPRTLKHTVTTGSDEDLYMMTEIGDGVFVQWGDCRKCHKRVGDCKCVGGPVEPDYMKPWRDERFARELKTRPEPSYDLLDTIIGWIRDRGYTVTKRSRPTPADGEAFDKADAKVAGDPVQTATQRLLQPPKAVPAIPDEGVDPEKVDEGLDAALEKVRAAKERDLNDFDADF